MEFASINNLTEQHARTVIYDQVPAIVRQLTQLASKQAEKSRPVSAEHHVMGPLLDAAAALPDLFEKYVRLCTQENIWKVSFGYSTDLTVPISVTIYRN